MLILKTSTSLNIIGKVQIMKVMREREKKKLSIQKGKTKIKKIKKREKKTKSPAIKPVDKDSLRDKTKQKCPIRTRVIENLTYEYF